MPESRHLSRSSPVHPPIVDRATWDAAQDVTAGHGTSREAAAMRACIRARFADLHDQREQIETQLQALSKTAPQATDPALLDELPALGDILPSLPPALKARLFAASGLEILWNKPGQQATVFAEITENTLQAIPGITDPAQDGYHDTSTETSTDNTAPT